MFSIFKSGKEVVKEDAVRAIAVKAAKATIELKSQQEEMYEWVSELQKELQQTRAILFKEIDRNHKFRSAKMLTNDAPSKTGLISAHEFIKAKNNGRDGRYYNGVYSSVLARIANKIAKAKGAEVVRLPYYEHSTISVLAFPPDVLEDAWRKASRSL